MEISRTGCDIFIVLFSSLTKKSTTLPMFLINYVRNEDCKKCLHIETSLVVKALTK